MDLAPDFDEFCGLLNAHHVDFVIVGAYALAFHGAPRFTGDLEFLIRPTEDNGRLVLAAIADFGFPVAPLTPADVVREDKLIEMGVSRDEFVRNKRAAGWPKDLADLAALGQVD